jgi:8-oxo-dGTP pyrophosphatase MutT (NUDIX family)
LFQVVGYGINKGIRTESTTIFREAVRGIIIDKTNLLMVHSSKNGDYKFPGGGIFGKETHYQTLMREIREECGALVTEIGPEFGKVIEYDVPLEREYDVFIMNSYYYFCQIERALFAQKLDQYEYDLGFHPVWVDIDTAILNNKDIASSILTEKIRWLPRETFILEQIRKRIFYTRD